MSSGAAKDGVQRLEEVDAWAGERRKQREKSGFSPLHSLLLCFFFFFYPSGNLALIYCDLLSPSGTVGEMGS